MMFLIRITILLVILSVFASPTSVAQVDAQKPRSVPASNNEGVKSELDLLAHELGRNEAIILIARAAPGESNSLSRRRLEVAREYLEGLWEIKGDRLITAIGDRELVKGTVNAYIRGKLFTVFVFKRNKNFAREP